MDPSTEISLDRLPLSDNEKRRIRIALSCRDADAIPKVPGAGGTFTAGSHSYQLMHNGVKVEVDGYYGPWMTELIRLLRGHHEPQEELVFHALVPYLLTSPTAVTMCELGSYWSYYSLWASQSISGVTNHLIEPDPNHLAVGLKNFNLNGATAQSHQYRVGRTSGPPESFLCESDRLTRQVSTIAVDDFCASQGNLTIDLLLADIQGAELDMLEGARRTIASGRLRFLFLSTHHHSISGDPLTHQKCMEFVRDHHGHVLAEHNVAESFSGDGLIVSSFLPSDCTIPPVLISRNHPTNSLFRELEYDLADALIALRHEQRRTRSLSDRLSHLERIAGQA